MEIRKLPHWWSYDWETKPNAPAGSFTLCATCSSPATVIKIWAEGIIDLTLSSEKVTEQATQQYAEVANRVWNYHNNSKLLKEWNDTAGRL